MRLVLLIFGSLFFNCLLAQPHKSFTLLKTPDGESFIFALLCSASSHRQIYGAQKVDCTCDLKKDHYECNPTGTYVAHAALSFILSADTLRGIIKQHLKKDPFCNRDIVFAGKKVDRQTVLLLAYEFRLKEVPPNMVYKAPAR